jgi:hypothetical protein
MTEHSQVGEGTLRELVDHDFGLMPKEYKRTFQIKAFNCKHEPIDIDFKKGQTIEFRKCNDQDLTWVGHLTRNGRRFVGKEKK